MISNAWLWMYAGMALMLLELAAPGFVIFFFGLAAMSVGIGRFIFGEAFTMNWQLAVFSTLSILYLVVLRKWFKSVFAGGKEESKLADEYVGRNGKVLAAINPPNAGRVVIGDSEWDATANCAIEAGSDVKVIARNNLTVVVEKVNAV
jgi:membrane protein implicated in regulation of membrane protease activity